MPVIDTCTIGTCLYRHRLLGQISTRPTRLARLARLFGRNVYGSGKPHESRTKQQEQRLAQERLLAVPSSVKVAKGPVGRVKFSKDNHG